MDSSVLVLLLSASIVCNVGFVILYFVEKRIHNGEIERVRNSYISSLEHQSRTYEKTYKVASNQAMDYAYKLAAIRKVLDE